MTSPFRPRHFLPGIYGADVPVVTPLVDYATPGNGPIAGNTVVFDFNLVNFDWVTWHNYEWQNWVQVDALLNTAIGFLNIRGIWKPNTDYDTGDGVYDPDNVSVFYRAVDVHTSGSDFDADITAGHWLLVASLGPPVESVHGRIGDVVAEEGDYSAFFYTKALADASQAAQDALITGLQTGLANTYTKTQIDATLLTYATDAEVATLLGGYYTKVASDARYYTKTEVDADWIAQDTRDDSQDAAISAAIANAYTKAQADARFLNLAGGTLTGPLILHADPASPLQAATKQYVDSGGTPLVNLSLPGTLTVAGVTTLNGPVNVYATETHGADIVMGFGWGLRFDGVGERAVYFGPSLGHFYLGFDTYANQRFRGPWLHEGIVEYGPLSTLRMTNNRQIQWYDVGGSGRQVLRVNNSDVCSVGNSVFELQLNGANNSKIIIAGSESGRFAGTGGRQFRCESMHAVEDFDQQFDNSVNRTASMLWPGQVYTQAHTSAGATGASFGGWWGTTKTAHIRRDGNMQNTNNSYGALSDERLKENVVDATPKLADILRLRIVNFNWINPQTPTKQIGVIAQEAIEVFPSLVDTEEDGMYSFKYSVLVPILVKAIQELTARVEALEA